MKPFDAVELYRRWHQGIETMHQVADAAGIDRETLESIFRLAEHSFVAGFEATGYCYSCGEIKGEHAPYQGPGCRCEEEE